jgi:DNA-binding MarR family transcriptional regulator
MRDDFKKIDRLEHLFWLIAQRMNLHTRRFLAKEGLTMARFIALSNISADGPMTMGELLRRLYQSPASLTGLIDGLVDAGLVIRWREETDRRAVFLSPTQNGLDLLDRVFAFRSSIMKEALAQYEGLEIEKLSNVMQKILEYIESVKVEEKRCEHADKRKL